MQDPRRAAGDVAVPHTSQVGAQVNATAGLVALYDQQGHVHYVPEADADFHVRQGLTREIYDPETLASEVDSLFEATRQAVANLCSAASSYGYVSREAEGEDATAHLAWGQLNDAVNHLFTGVHLRYGAHPDTLLPDPKGAPDPDQPMAMHVHTIDCGHPDDQVPEFIRRERETTRFRSHLDSSRIPDNVRPTEFRRQGGQP